MFRAAFSSSPPVFALGVVASAEAAAPRLIMVSGEPLTDPILVSDAEQVFELYQSFFQSQPVERADLEARRSLRLGLFWDNTLWEPYVRQGRLDELTPEAGEPGRVVLSGGWRPARSR